ncbi:MAG: DUF5677 domain-containing protein [Oscillospiraceae bacterium]
MSERLAEDHCRIVTVPEHKIGTVLENVISVAQRKIPALKDHEVGGTAYTRVMLTFLCRHLELADVLNVVCKSFKPFPIMVGAGLARGLFELHIDAAYISLKPLEYTKQYIEYIDVAYRRFAALRENAITASEGAIKDFLKSSPMPNVDPAVSGNTKWSETNMKERAKKTDHLTDYCCYYPFLCGLVHGDIIGAQYYSNFDEHGFTAKNITTPEDAASIVNLSAQFLTCFLNNLSDKFELKLDSDLRACWKV